MGGEPTFVSMDDPEGEEWNTAALGPNKRRLAAELYHRLRKRYGAQGLVHFGQGKWYPGEQLPRWSLNCFWRADGEPIWRDDSLIADETQAGEATEATTQASFSEASPSGSAWIRRYVFPGLRRSCITTCGASAACPPTSIRSIRGSKIRSNASVSCACSAKA